MIGIYFSGTGNSRYAIELFCKEYDKNAQIFSIEDSSICHAIKNKEMLIFAYPVQYSTVPKILRDFIIDNKELWTNKKVFVIATMGLFSGDGAGILGRLLNKYGAKIIGGLHLKMPDSISDVKLLKRSPETNKTLIKKAELKIKNAVHLLNINKPPQEGIGILHRIAGFLGQRLYFGHITKNYSNKLRVNTDKCIACMKCEKLCPTKNIKVIDKKISQNNQCTMCYRCINNCPKQAITLLGNSVVQQSLIEKHLD